MAEGFWASVVRLLKSTQSGKTGQKARPGRAKDQAKDQARGQARQRISTRTWGTGKSTAKPRPAPQSPSSVQKGNAYAGDFTGKATLSYAPIDDGKPDPGEVVWAWVPFEEDHSQGKDRPVLVIARNRGKLLGLMLTSKDHDRDAAQEAHHGRFYLDVGTGAWDRQGRPSEVRVDRILQLDPDAVRREGATLDRKVYDQVAATVRKAKNWN